MERTNVEMLLWGTTEVHHPNATLPYVIEKVVARPKGITRKWSTCLKEYKQIQLNKASFT